MNKRNISNINWEITNSSGKLPGAWFIVAQLFIIGLLNYLDRTTITTMRESVVGSISMTDSQFGLLTSVFLWVYAALSPFAGFLADRFSRSKVILFSLITWSVVTALTGFCTTYGQLLATRALMGISEAFYIPAALALILDYHRGSTQSLATGINIGGMMMGSSLGFVGGVLAEHHSWQFAFHIFGIVGIVYSLVVAFTLRDAPIRIDLDDEKSPTIEKSNVSLSEAAEELFSNKSFILLVLFWGLLGAIGWLIIGWLPTYYSVHFNLSQGVAGFYATALVHPFAIAGVILGGILADKWAKRNPKGRIYIPMIGLFVAAFGTFISGFTSIFILAVIFFAIYSLTRSFSDANLMPILNMVIDSRYKATGYGILNFMATLVGGLGIYFGGALRDLNIELSSVFRFCAFLLVIAALLLIMVKTKEDKKSQSNHLNNIKLHDERK